MDELGDKVEEQEKSDIEAAIKEVEESINGDDKAVIEEKTQKLTGVASKLAERVYQQTAEQSQSTGAEAGAADNSETETENVVDAEFEEVDDEKK